MGVRSLVCGVLGAVGVAAFADSSAIYRFDWYAGGAVADFPAPMTLR